MTLIQAKGSLGIGLSDTYGIDVNIYTHNNAPGTYAHIRGYMGYKTTIDISTGGVLYTYHLNHTDVYGTGWGAIINNSPTP